MIKIVEYTLPGPSQNYYVFRIEVTPPPADEVNPPAPFKAVIRTLSGSPGTPPDILPENEYAPYAATEEAAFKQALDYLRARPFHEDLKEQIFS